MKFLAFLAIAIYLICSLSYIDKPGLYYDETLFVNVALGNEDGSFIDLEAPIGPYRIPVMLMPYIGALKSYFYFPISGGNVFSMDFTSNGNALADYWRYNLMENS